MTRSAVVSHVILQYSERRGVLTIDPDWAPVNDAYRATQNVTVGVVLARNTREEFTAKDASEAE